MKKLRRLMKGLAVVLTAAMVVGIMPGMGITKASAAEVAESATSQVNSTADVWNGSVATSFAGGTGIEGDPYLIATGAQLAYFAKVVNATAYADNEYAKAYYKLTADIDLNNNTWTQPIGKGRYSNDCFNGHFDGNNKTISNLSGSYGLFYNVGGNVTIKDFTLANVNISGSSYIGGLIYMVYKNMGTSALISNCNILGTVESTSGSAVGLVYRADSPLTIEDCSNSANITGQSYSAGILGSNYTKSTFDDYFITIRNCNNSGTIVNTCTSNNYGAAGIAGNLQYGKTLIENCVNTGEIVAQNGGEKYAGIVSNSSSTEGNTIRNCENYGAVTCDVAKSSIYTAGICAAASYTEIYDCSNVGTIHNYDSALYCGGIVARRYSSSDTVRGTVYNCFNAGTIEPSYGGQIIGSEDTLSNVYDNYYVNGNLAANSVNNQNNYRVSQEQAESGYLAFVMNGLTSGNVWKQKLGTDIYPKINGSEDIVYANGNCSAKVTEYSNTPLTMDANNNHDLIQVSASNADCGHNGYKEHYECKSCNAFFENGTGDTPVRKKDFITGMATGNHQSYDANGLCAICGNAYEKPEKDENGFYVIKNTGNFIWYANAINNYNYISIPVGDAEIQLDGFDAKLDADINLSLVYNEESGKSWTPIAYDYSKYLNELDGQGHTINGLYINSASLNYAGLVETMYYKTAYIHDIVFTNVNINAPRAAYVGTVAGKMESLKTAPCIENCIVESGTINGKTYVGGLVGYVCANNADKFQQENKNIINNCANFANVKSTSYAGGLVGYTEANGKNVNIANCYNVGTSIGGTSGDLVGKIDANTTVVNCYYLGSKAFGENTVSATAEQKTEEQFGSGEVAWLLQNGQTAENGGNTPQVWGQKLGEVEDADKFPVLDGSKKVYQTSPCISYVNESDVTKEHIDTDNNGKCDTCDTYIDGIGAKLAGYSLSLNGNIGVNFYMELSEEIAGNENAYMEFALPNTAENMKVYVKGNHDDGATATTDNVKGKSYYVFSCEVAAKEMTDEIQAQMIAGDNKSTVYTYTVKDYADYILSHTETYGDKVVALVKAMLNYGAYSQTYFGYQTENLANAGLEEADRVLGDLTAEQLITYKASVNKKEDVCTFASAYLTLKSETAVNVYVKLADGVSENDVTFKIDDSEIAKENLVMGTGTYEGYYILSVDNITASKLDDMHTFTITTGEQSASLTYGPMSYCYSVLAGNTLSDDLKNVVKALYAFNQNAKEYVAS